MSQAARQLRLTESPTPLPGLPQGPLSPQQQLEAIRRTQDQAEQRVELGMKLLGAAEAHAVNHQHSMEQVRSEQQVLRDKLEQDVAKSLHTFDQWIGDLDDGFTKALKQLEDRVDTLSSQWVHTQHRIEQMVKRSETLLDEHRLDAAAVPTSQPQATLSVAPPVQEQASSEDGMPVTDEGADAAGAKENEPDKPTYGELLRRLLEQSDG